MLPDFNRLKVFYFIYSLNSIVDAADALHITPSAISQNLQKLEAELKTQLFTRLHKRLVPTIEAENLFAIVNPFIEELELGLKSLRKGKKTPAGMLRIGAPVEFGKKYLPEIFASFRDNYPDVTFFLKLGDPATLLPMINKGELDFALIDEFLIKKHDVNNINLYSIKPVFYEEVILACSKKYYDRAVKGDHSLENLIKKDFISYQTHDLILKSWFKHHFTKPPPILNIVMTVDNIHTVVSGIKHNIGLGITASHLVLNDIRSGTVVPINTPKKELINTISLVQFQDKIPNLAERKFQLHLLESILVKSISPHTEKA